MVNMNFRLFFASITLVLFGFTAHSAEFVPNSDITLIVSFKEGSGTDIGAKILSKYAPKYFKHNLIIKNIPGENGITGWKALINSKPDGLTIGYLNLPTFTSYTIPPHNVFKIDDVVPICNHLTETSVVVVRSDSPYNSLGEFVKTARENGGFKASTNGEQASNHTATQLFASTAKFQYEAINCNGTADQLLSLIKGEVDFCCAKVGDVASLVSEEKPLLKILGVFSEKRLQTLPQVPTLHEFGYYDKWYGSLRGIVGPKGMTHEMVKYYEDNFYKLLNDPEVIAAHKARNLYIDFRDPLTFGAMILAQEFFCRDVLPTLYHEKKE